MSYKLICDVCKNDITSKNDIGGLPTARPVNCATAFEMMNNGNDITFKLEMTNQKHMCKYCIFDFFNHYDDRPKALQS